MLNLAAATDKFQMVTSAAASVDYVTVFMDLTMADPPAVKGSTSGIGAGNVATATTTDVVPAPGASILRNLKTFHARNKHASASVDITFQINRNGTIYEIYKTTLVAGASVEYVEGIGWYVLAPATPTMLFKVLSADDAGGQNVATAQPWFPTQGAITVAADTTYKMDGHLYLTRAAGVVSHTTSILFAGTATLTSIQYQAKVNVGDVDTLLPVSRVVGRSAAAQVAKAASTSATEAISVDLEGIVRINAAGTFIPQFQYSAAPGGAPTIKANSNFFLTPLGNGSVTTQGTWS